MIKITCSLNAVKAGKKEKRISYISEGTCRTTFQYFEDAWKVYQGLKETKTECKIFKTRSGGAIIQEFYPDKPDEEIADNVEKQVRKIATEIGAKIKTKIKREVLK